MITFTFGMYKGQKVNDIIEQNPSYIRWCLNNVSYFTLDNNQKELLNKQSNIVSRSLSKIYPDGPYDDEEPWNGYDSDMRSCFDPNY